MLRLIIIISISFLSVFNAIADENNITDNERFTVKNISVNEVGLTSEEARKKAIAYAQKTAFRIMLERFFSDLKDQEFEFEQITNIVQSIEYKSEIITNQSYKALLDISFAPEQTKFFINNHLLNKKINKLSILIIPLYDENGMIKLWQKGNVWYDAWLRGKASQIVDIKILPGDIDDMMNFKVSELYNMTEEQIEELTKSYQVNEIIIADLKYYYQTLAEEVEFKAYLKQLGDSDNSILVAKSEGVKDENHTKHMDYLVKRITENIENGWMKYNEETESANKQNFIIKVSNLKQLHEMQEKLEKLDVVSNFRIDAFSARYAKITIEFFNKPLEVIDYLQQFGFKISREKDFVILQLR
ncbi:MAG: DUF2066 domain-containing protein [Rickettsiales bacterium]|nr:DUF2066 domain-containing protein [Rickettsiales bacterium]